MNLISSVPNPYLLEEAHFSDLEEIIQIEKMSQPSPWERSLFERELLLEYSHLWVIRQKEQRVIAYICFWLVADEVHILNVVVHPRFRKQGLGKALIDSLMENTRNLSIVAYTLEVRESNGIARRLYEKMGFLEVGKRPNYYADNGEAAIVMTKIGEETGDEFVDE